ncbi:HU family DNA-binding protein [Candidatus Acetothermia bacterium]|nr:HU family DNA-binding protein [Candidatus Acetothermia bacterium]MBI3661345.1 HU family DNA-binding protein [Candidatus Acetothermia bacterium]
MNKNEFVEKLSAKTGLSKKGAREALDAVTGLISETLSKNEPVLLTGFGKFEPRARRESNRINPQTQARIRVPRKVVPAFKPGKALKDKIGRNLRVVEKSGRLEVGK